MILKLKTRRKKTDRQKQEALLDELWSELVRRTAMRLAGGCQRCKMPKIDWHRLQAAHCWGKTARTTRWDERNGAGLCGGCHNIIDKHDVEAKEILFRELLGDEEYERLYVLAHMTTKQSPVDYKLTEIALRELLKEVWNEN